MNFFFFLAEEYLQSLNDVRFISDCSDPSNRKLVNSNSGSVCFSFFPNSIYGIKVKALDIHFVKCEISDNMVDAFV